MTDIVLIQPPIRDFYLTAKRTIAYGLAGMAACLRDAGFSVDIIDALACRRVRDLALPPAMAYLAPYYGRADRSPFALFHRFKHFGLSPSAIAEQARQADPLLVGIAALFSAYSDQALAVARAVKAACPSATVVVGGHHATSLAAHVLAEPAVDFVITGEGEQALTLLAAALRRGANLTDVPGLVRRRTNGGLVAAAPAVVADLNTLPLPASDLLDNAFYRRGPRGAAVVMASRGCPLSCSYCCLGKGSWQPFRRRSVASVMAEVEAAVTQFGAGFIDFEDENISFDRAWFLELLGAITVRFGPETLELRAMNGLLPTRLDHEVITAMKVAGFTALNLSLGSACPAQLKRFGRPDVIRAFDRALASAQALAMTAVGYVIAGAPDQDPQDSLDDLLFLAARPVLAGLSVFYPAPGSRDFERCRQLGILPADLNLWRSSALPLDHTTSRLQTVTLMRLARLLNFIKARLDKGLGLPPPQGFAPPITIDPADRWAAGERLLGFFLKDGTICGVEPDGAVFAHLTDAGLCERFRQGLGRIAICGTASANAA